MKAAVITSVASMVEQFLYPSVKLLKECGYEVTVACNFENGNTCSPQQTQKLKRRLFEDNIHYTQIDFSRDIKRLDMHVKAYKQIQRLLGDSEFKIVHCHSPIGGLITRMALGRNHKEYLIYTAHGFHFYNGASVQNWILFFPIEYAVSKNTDVLITINKEDYELAKKRLCAKKTVYIPGVGIDTDKVSSSIPSIEKVKAFRKQIGISEDQIMILSVGELNKNKNHISVIRALGEVYKNNSDLNWMYVICGQGKSEEDLLKEAERLLIVDRVKLLGYIEDIFIVMRCANLFIHPSYREGLSVALMEAIATGCPVLCSDIRGNRDLVDNEMMFKPNDVNTLSDKISKFLNKEADEDYKELLNKSKKQNELNLKKCEISCVKKKLERLYRDNI